jgi:hypothetical protein
MERIKVFLDHPNKENFENIKNCQFSLFVAYQEIVDKNLFLDFLNFDLCREIYNLSVGDLKVFAQNKMLKLAKTSKEKKICSVFVS